MKNFKTKLSYKKPAIKKMIVTFIAGFIVINVLAILYFICIVDKVVVKTLESYEQHYGNLLIVAMGGQFIISTFLGCILMGYIIGKGGWKFAAISSILIFLLQHLPGIIQYNTLLLASILTIPFGTLGGAIGTQLKMRTGKLA